jgi:hypothetical protein
VSPNRQVCDIKATKNEIDENLDSQGAITSALFAQRIDTLLQKKNALVKRWMKKWRNRFGIEINKSFLERTMVLTTKTARKSTASGKAAGKKRAAPFDLESE